MASNPGGRITLPLSAPQSQGKTLAALIGIAAAGLATGSVMSWEGKENTPYQDVVKVWTVCYGDTNRVVPGRRESDAQCLARLDAQLIEHALPVLRCTPRIRMRPSVVAAAVSLSYNIGGTNYCRSTVARRFNAGDFRGGCNAMLAWNRAGGQVVRGLTRRREAERALCLRDAG